MVIITHNIALTRQLCDHISLLWQGRIVASGPAVDLFNSDDAFVRQFLTGEVAGPLGMD
jgi:phospholipid/cholesterol/gamma-HCH transport system ATP-binding protein